MLVLIHVLFALGSLAVAGINLLSPSRQKLQATYSLSGATIFTGIWLIIGDKAHILATCITGLIYISAIVAATALVRYRLNKLKIT